MDTSEIYIKMCEKAEEVQELWKPQEGDCCVERKYPDIPLFLLEDVRGWGFITAVSFGDDDPLVQEDSIWLPRQDQLQEMLDYKVQYGDYPSRFYLFACQEDYPKQGNGYLIAPACDLLITWEQLWFGFAMKSLYQKTWSGTEWIEI